MKHHILLKTLLFSLFFIALNQIYSQTAETLDSLRTFQLDSLKSTKSFERSKFSLEKKIRNKRRKQLRKTQDRDLRFISTRLSRRVWQMEYDFLNRSFTTNNSNKEVLKYIESAIDTSMQKVGAFPPIELHEYDGIELKFINVNPFIYTVNVTEIQSDRIASSTLSSADRTVSATFEVPKISSLRLISGFGVYDSELEMSRYKSEKMNAELNELKSELNDILESLEIANLDSTKKDQTISAINLKTKEIKNTTESDLNESNNEQLNDTVVEMQPSKPEQVGVDSLASTGTTDTADQHRPLNEVNPEIKEVTNKKAEIDTLKDALRKVEDDLRKEVDTLYMTIEKANLDNQNIINSAIIRAHLVLLQSAVDSLRHGLQELNTFVIFHNQILQIANSPQNTAQLMRNEFDELKKELYKEYGLNRILNRTSKIQNQVFTQISEIKSQIKTIQNFGDSLKSGDSYRLGLLESETDLLLDQLGNLDVEQMIGRIRDIDILIVDQNFTIVHHSLNISDNADYVYVNFDFRQKPSIGIPKGKGDFSLGIGFNVREGVKIDISPCILYEYGIVSEGLYFETDGQAAGQALVRSGDRSRFNIGASVLLNVYKRSSNNIKIGGSIGFGISESFDARFSVGPNLIIGRKERIVISAGPIFGVQERAADGFEAGEIVNINEELLQTGVPSISDGITVGGYIGLGFNLFGEDTKEFLTKGLQAF